jgi:hypothetical protein
MWGSPCREDVPNPVPAGLTEVLVALRHHDRGVPQQLLHLLDCAAILDDPGRVGVAEVVDGDVPDAGQPDRAVPRTAPPVAVLDRAAVDAGEQQTGPAPAAAPGRRRAVRRPMLDAAAARAGQRLEVVVEHLHDGMDVLEIGTGTGYNAALLCERLGHAHVTTIDIGPELTALARVRLAEHGYWPHVATGDGACGVPGRDPFNRIVATCGLDAVPQAWIDQTRDAARSS